MHQREIELKVRQFVDRDILRGQGADLTATTSLFELGILDSFTLFTLINFVATEFSVTLPLEALKRESFETTNAIAMTIHEQVSAGASSRAGAPKPT
jgi:acyl carrier protein